MPRGIVPRQPAKTGRHEGRVGAAAARTGKIRPDKVGSNKAGAKKARFDKARVGPAALGRSEKPKPKPKTVAYHPTTPERVQEILRRLDQTYPGVTCALTHGSAWELLVATILSAQCTDVRVNMVTPVLFQKYPTIEDFAALKPEQLEPDIRSTGFFRNKSKSLVGAARKITGDFGGQVPNEMDKLLTIPGVARKTANVVLGTWFKKNEGVVVDTHVTRIARRLELTRETDPAKIERDLVSILPREKWTDFSHQVIWHGRRLCIARMPKCVDCPLETICHAADKTWSTVEIHKGAK